MIDPRFVILGALISLGGDVVYAWSTLKGKTKPNRVTWFLWAFIPFVTFFAQLKSGVQWEAVLTLAIGLGPLLIFIASLANRKAFWKITKLDIVCGVLSLMALALWFATGHGAIAIVLSIVADILAGIPTYIKAFKEPETEHPTAYLGGVISATITLLITTSYTLETSAFAVYLLVACLVLYLLVKFKLGKKLLTSRLHS